MGSMNTIEMESSHPRNTLSHTYQAHDGCLCLCTKICVKIAETIQQPMNMDNIGVEGCGLNQGC